MNSSQPPSPTWKAFRQWKRQQLRSTGEVFAKMHQLWPEDNAESVQEFFAHANKGEKYLYNH